MMPSAILLLAQAKPAGFLEMAPMFAAMIAIFYFIVLRPQQKQMKEQQSLLSALKKGDEVVTSSGILGKVFSVADKEVMLEVGPGVKIRVLKSAIQGKAPTDAPVKSDEPAIKKEEK